jgi:hypothetical protein
MMRGRPSLAINSIINRPASVRTQYVKGTGVGATSAGLRRALQRAGKKCCK